MSCRDDQSRDDLESRDDAYRTKQKLRRAVYEIAAGLPAVGVL